MFWYQFPEIHSCLLVSLSFHVTIFWLTIKQLFIWAVENINLIMPVISQANDTKIELVYEGGMTQRKIAENFEVS